MNIYKNITEVPKLKNAIVTIGSFDGLHMAHKKLINRIHLIANELAGDALVVTFHPHPRSIVFPNDKTLSLLSTIEEKIKLFEQNGVKHLLIIPFTVEFAQLSAHEYIEKFLIKALNSKYLVVGYDHKFGLARQGDFALLKMYEKEGHFKLIEIEKQEIDEMAVSSTNIRKAISNKDIPTANALLGAYYYIQGKVTKGDSIGRTIGYPTANLSLLHKDKLIPPVGIYACYVNIANQRFKGMLYIGNRPTINNEKKQVIEVNIFDFNDNIYDEIIGLEIVSFIREDEKFESLEALKDQLDLDRTSTIEVFSNIKDPEKKNDVSISILNYNGAKLFEKYLPSVFISSEKYSYEVIVVDNKSTDDSVKVLKENFPQIKLVQLTKNHGFASGYNKGNVEIESKYTVLLNSDVKVTPNWLDPLIQQMDSDKTIGAIQPKILSDSDPEKFEYAGASGGFIDSHAYPFCRGRILNDCEKDLGQYDDPIEVFWTSGAAMIIRTELFKNSGGFDGSFFAHQEEIDLCWRIKKAGYKCIVNPSSVVYHLGGGTLKYENPKKTYLNFRNNLSMLLKNESFPKVIFIFLLRLVLDGIAGLNFLRQGKWQHTLSIIKAHFSVYARLPFIIQKRNMHNNFIRKNSIGATNNSGKKTYSILWKYYLLGKKTYSEIDK